jgi:hypothetical protein
MLEVVIDMTGVRQPSTGLGPDIPLTPLLRPRQHFAMLAGVSALVTALVVWQLTSHADAYLLGAAFVAVAFGVVNGLRAAYAVFYADSDGVHYRSWPTEVRLLAWDQIAEVDLARRLTFRRGETYRWAPALHLSGGDVVKPFWDNQERASEAADVLQALLIVEQGRQQLR